MKTRREYTPYAAWLEKNPAFKPLLPIHEERGHKVGLRRHILQKEVFDEVLVNIEHCGPNAEFTLGAVRKVLTAEALRLVQNCDRLTVKMEDDIPFVTYHMDHGEYSEVSQYINRDSRPREVWVMLVDPEGQVVGGSQWDHTELPSYVRPRRKEMARF